MTTKEFKIKVSEATDLEWHKSVEVTFNFPYLNFVKPIKGITAIFEFVVNQAAEWDKFQGNLPKQLANSKNYFINIQGQLESFIINYYSERRTYLDNHFNNVRNHIANTNNYPFVYASPEAEFLLKIHTDYPAAFLGAYNFIIGNANYNSLDKNSFIGAIMAYEFSMKDYTEIVARRNAERQSLSKLRSEFHNYLTTSENQLVEHLQGATQNYVDYLKQIDVLKTDKETFYNEWFNNTQSGFNTFNSDSNQKVKDLEKAYEELLRLKKPAEYWKLRAAELKKEGWRSLHWLIGLVTFSCFTLYLLLWLTPEGMLKSFFNEDKSLAIRWTIIFITFISFLFFGVRALMKVTFSSFHLARDAEERERLTYVYLAMVKDASVDKEDRHLIMQSLFSRADTGLLKEDSSPTMPGVGGFFDKIASR